MQSSVEEIKADLSMLKTYAISEQAGDEEEEKSSNFHEEQKVLGRKSPNSRSSRLFKVCKVKGK
jgi:hypothetical protein